VTAVGPLAGIGAVGLAAVGDAWLTTAALLVVASGLLDSVDGAVAVLTDRVTRWGQVLDHLVDRVTDLLYLVALWLAGAPGQACVAGGVLMLLLEYVRARAAVAGMTEVGVVTVWERPTRVIVTAAFLASGVFGDLWPALGAAAWVGLGMVGLGQLLVVVRRRLA
ncbi:MAG: CDP-alcohol phosphatidyltransferase family protein, partial [Actinomycetes bacterium]